jgi:hypothetical protein
MVNKSDQQALYLQGLAKGEQSVAAILLCQLSEIKFPHKSPLTLGSFYATIITNWILYTGYQLNKRLSSCQAHFYSSEIPSEPMKNLESNISIFRLIERKNRLAETVIEQISQAILEG